MARDRYEVRWGKSVYYKHVFDPEFYHKKRFTNKKKAMKFLSMLNKSETYRGQEVDHTDMVKLDKVM